MGNTTTPRINDSWYMQNLHYCSSRYPPVRIPRVTGNKSIPHSKGKAWEDDLCKSNKTILYTENSSTCSALNLTVQGR